MKESCNNEGDSLQKISGFGTTDESSAKKEFNQVKKMEKKKELKVSIPRRTNVTSHNYSVLNAEKVSESTGELREHDGIIKHLLENARFTGYLLTRIIPEMKGVTLDQFCEYTNTDPDTGGDLKQQATEISSAGLKDIRLDLVFEYDAEAKLLLRINEEPQTTQKSYSETTKESYSLIARAAYYASLAMVTGIQSKEEYHLIRKVYSIWVCFARPIPDVKEPVISYSLKPDEDYKYIDGTSLNSNKRKFDNGDLMGIIMISVPDLEDFIAKGKSTKKYSLETLTELYNLLSNKVSYEERKDFYYDTTIVKEEFEMGNSVSTIERMHEKEKQAEEINKQTDERIKQFEEAKVVETLVAAGSRHGWSDSTIVQEIAEQLKITQQEAEDLFDLYIS